MGGSVAIGIPMYGKKRVASWERLTALLSHTLLTVFRQTSSDYQIAIAYNDRPHGGLLDDPRITWLPVDEVEGDEKVHGEFADKYAKLQVLQRWAADSGAAYYFALDNDDLISNRLVEYVVTAPPSVGFRLVEGYAYESRSGMLSPLPHPILPETTFDQWCGSSIIVRIDPTAPPLERMRRLDAIWDMGHWGANLQFPVVTGSQATTVPFRAALYRLNSGENFSLRKEREKRGKHISDWVFLEQAFKPDEKLRAEFSLPAASRN